MFKERCKGYHGCNGVMGVGCNGRCDQRASSVVYRWDLVVRMPVFYLESGGAVESEMSGMI